MRRAPAARDSLTSARSSGCPRISLRQAGRGHHDGQRVVHSLPGLQQSAHRRRFRLARASRWRSISRASLLTSVHRPRGCEKTVAADRPGAPQHISIGNSMALALRHAGLQLLRLPSMRGAPPAFGAAGRFVHRARTFGDHHFADQAPEHRPPARNMLRPRVDSTMRRLRVEISAPAHVADRRLEGSLSCSCCSLSATRPRAASLGNSRRTPGPAPGPAVGEGSGAPEYSRPCFV